MSLVSLRSFPDPRCGLLSQSSDMRSGTQTFPRDSEPAVNHLPHPHLALQPDRSTVCFDPRSKNNKINFEHANSKSHMHADELLPSLLASFSNEK